MSEEKILFIDDPPLFSGGQRMLRNYLSFLNGKYRVLIRPIGAPETSDSWEAEKVYNIPFAAYPQNMSSFFVQFKCLPRTLISAFDILRIIHIEKPNLIIVNSFYALIPLFLIKSFIKAPILFVVHTSDVPINAAGRRLLGICKGWIGCCHYVVDRLPDIKSINKHVVYNAVGFSQWKNKNTTKNKQLHTIVFAGRLLEQKHPFELVRAIESLNENGNSLRAYILGDGPEKPRLEQYVRDNHLDEFITLTGNVDNAREYIAAADAVCLPSEYAEGLPICLLEGMADGVPPIAYGTGGVPEMIDHLKNGILLKGTDVDSIIDGINKLQQLPGAKVQEALKRKYDKYFSLQAQTKSFNEVISMYL